ncbi:MAG: tyramine oxidase subunit B [Spirochaetes bacterium]|nr:tyramine oxidase subunit B [Spirochaetota bacterium]
MSQKVEFLYLSEPDMIKAGVLNAKRCVEVMDETFQLLGKGDYLMGGPEIDSHGLMLFFPGESKFPKMPLAGPDRRYMAMPAYLGGRFHLTGVKWYGSNRANIAKGLPRSILMLCLNDAETGAPMAIMSANLLSAMRTGAVPGVATKYLASKSARNLAVIGCGVINRACTRGILENMPKAEKMLLCDIDAGKCEEFAKELKAEYSVESVAVSLEEAIRSADVVTVAVSGEKGVRIDPSWLKPGCLLTSSGAMDLPDEAFLKNTVAFDHWSMHKLWLEEALAHKDGLDFGLSWGATSAAVLKALHAGRLDAGKFISLSDVAAGTGKARKSDDEIIIFYSGGLPVEDISWGAECYEQAKKLGLGHTDKVWDQAHWR